MSAKDAVLSRTGSHRIEDRGSGAADGISNEQVFAYFTAKWRGQPVIVTMQADRYAASNWDEKTGTSTNRLTDWRVYANEAHFYDPEKNGGRGAEVSGTARSALSKLCQPFVIDWLATDAYTVSFQAAAARLILRKFDDDRYSVSRRVTDALAVFRSRLTPAMFRAISETLVAYDAYDAAKARAFTALEG